MGFRCIVCKRDFGYDQKELYKHLMEDHRKDDISSKVSDCIAIIEKEIKGGKNDKT